MQRLCTKLRSLASVSSSHRLLHSSPQFYHRPLHFAAASSKWSLNGSLLNTSSSLPIQLPSLPFLTSFHELLFSGRTICTSFYIWFNNFAPNANHFFSVLQTGWPETNACRIIVQKGIVIIAEELNSGKEFEEPMSNLV